jgi:hypothetical protein
MSLYNVSLDSQCFLQRGRGNFGLTFDAREHMLYYTENVTKSIGRINLVIGEPGASIIKGVGDVQGITNVLLFPKSFLIFTNIYF